MKILALEFSSPQRSVAVLNLESGSIAEAVDTSRGHTMKPFRMVEDALRQAGLELEQIELVAVGLGPGSYTGIRAAIAMAQGWRLARGVKLCGVSSAECLASQEAADGLYRFSIVIDAQRGEFYRAPYEVSARGDLRPVAPIQIVTSDVIRDREATGELIVGPEVTKWFPNGRTVFPRAAALARMVSTGAALVAGEKLEPIYLRETSFVKTSAYSGSR